MPRSLDGTKTESVIGPPGTGKTSYLIQKAVQRIKEGATPDQISFVSYTRRAAREGAERIKQACPNVQGAFTWFTTLHSLAFKNIDVGSDRVLNPGDRELAKHMKDRLGYGLQSTQGRNVAKLHSLSRVSDMTYEEMALKVFAPRLPPCSSEELERFAQAYTDFKAENHYVDFDDLLDEFLRNGHVPRLALFLVDEAQDLAAKLWRVVEKIGEQADQVVLAGDNDQMLYEWAGADDGAFARYFGGAQVLQQSRRCPMAVAAKANRVIAPVRSIERTWVPTDVEGQVTWISDLSAVSVGENGSWFVLCRTNARVERLSEELRDRLIYHAVVHHGRTRPGFSSDLSRLLGWWRRLVIDRSTARRTTTNWALRTLGIEEEVKSESITAAEVPDLPGSVQELVNRPLYGVRLDDLDYLRGLVASGVDVTRPPTTWVMTINQAKGSEADYVVVDTYASREVRETFRHQLGPETRQAYVAITRARTAVFCLSAGDHLACYDW